MLHQQVSRLKHEVLTLSLSVTCPTCCIIACSPSASETLGVSDLIHLVRVASDELAAPVVVKLRRSLVNHNAINIMASVHLLSCTYELCRCGECAAGVYAHHEDQQIAAIIYRRSCFIYHVYF